MTISQTDLPDDWEPWTPKAHVGPSGSSGSNSDPFIACTAFPCKQSLVEARNDDVPFRHTGDLWSVVRLTQTGKQDQHMRHPSREGISPPRFAVSLTTKSEGSGAPTGARVQRHPSAGE